eukprot:Seg930.2 transcript_id=Seg930.2/GoldUCD/mRNA.D3Y31 product="Secretion-regulating guanine nucleotide exchange factor" protein_id=Seg930.2/GoldUCD/D3Y31
MEIFSWGANSYGQLGLGNVDDHLLPQKVTQFWREGDIPNFVMGGGGHTAVITEAGNLFMAGWNDCGQLGSGTNDNQVRFQNVDFAGKVKYVSCGWNHTLLLDENGTCFSFGSNSFGQLGLLNTKREHRPTIVEGITAKVGVVAAGMRHSVALTENGEIYTWGCGKKGQLGHGDTKNQVAPKRVKFPDGEMIKDIRAGAEFTIALSESGAIYCWGANTHGQCGVPGPRIACNDSIEKFKMITQPRIVKLPNTNIKSIHCGWSSVAVLTGDGEVIAWGRGDYGQLGQGDCLSRCEPMRVPISKGRVKDIRGGSEHNIAVVDDNRLAVWGWNEHGMCATGDEHNVLSPHFVDSSHFSGREIAFVSCGAGTSFVAVMARS